MKMSNYVCRHYFRLLVSGLILWLFTSPEAALAQPGDSTRLLTEEAYLEWVMAHHPVARRARLLLAEAEATELMARGAFDPKLYADWDQKSFDGKEYYTHGETGFKIPTWFGVELKGNFLVSSGDFLSAENELPVAGQAVAGVKVSLLQGMFIDERRASLRQAELLARLNEADRELWLNDLLLDAAKAYWDWGVAYNRLLIFERAFAVTRQRFDGIVESFKVGDLPAVDTLETMIQLQNREFDVNEAQLEYRNATLALSNFLWLDGNVPLEVSDAVRPPSSIEWPEESVIPSQRVFQELLSVRHPELRYYQVKLEQLEIDRRLSAEMLKPRLDFEYNFLGDGFDFFGPAPNEDDGNLRQLFLQNYKWAVHFSYPLLLRKERGKLQLNKIKMMDTDYTLQQKRLELTNKVGQYYNDLINLRQQIELNQDMLTNYQLLLDAENLQFSIGESSIFLINSREQKLIEAQLKLAKLRGTFRKTRAGLSWAAGVLLEEVN